VVGAVVELAETVVVKGMHGADLIMEMKDAKGSQFRGVEVELGLFEWGKLFDWEVLW